MKNIFYTGLIMAVASIVAIPEDLKIIKAKFEAIATAGPTDSQVKRIGELEIAVSEEIRERYKKLADAIEVYAKAAAKIQVELEKSTKCTGEKVLGPQALAKSMSNLESAQRTVAMYLASLENSKK